MHYPVLLQKKIEGTLLDLSSFYLNGDLIYFSYSEILRSRPNKFGPSVLRKYHPIASLKKDIYDELHKLGKALGANGFVNIACIQSHIDNKRYYFEADMRPNVWVHYSKYIEQDPAVTIRNHFQNKHSLKFDDSKASENFETKVLPYLPRMHWYEIVTNRYNCWSFYEIQIRWPYFIQSITDYINWTLSKEGLKVIAVKCIKPLTPPSVWKKIKNVLLQTV